MSRKRHPEEDRTVRLGSTVQTQDGEGTTLGMPMRRASNGGPGSRQYRVRLTDGRIRHYTRSMIEDGR